MCRLKILHFLNPFLIGDLYFLVICLENDCNNIKAVNVSHTLTHTHTYTHTHTHTHTHIHTHTKITNNWLGEERTMGCRPCNFIFKNVLFFRTEQY